MTSWTSMNRPVTVQEIAFCFGVSPQRMRRIIDRHSIRLVCRIGRLKLYGGPQLRRLYDLTEPLAVAAS